MAVLAEVSQRTRTHTSFLLLCQRFDSDKAGDREVQRTMLELLNQLDGFQPNDDIKVSLLVHLRTCRSFSSTPSSLLEFLVPLRICRHSVG